MKHILLTLLYFVIITAIWPTIAWLIYGIFDHNHFTLSFWAFAYFFFLTLDGIYHRVEETYDFVKEHH